MFDRGCKLIGDASWTELQKDTSSPPLLEVATQLATQRAATVKRISSLAGEERTRRELIPFVNESVDDEDEILLALAEELGQFVPLVGGAQHAHFLLPPLESLATVDETVVRERAVASICTVAGQMPPENVQEHLLPMLQVC